MANVTQKGDIEVILVWDKAVKMWTFPGGGMERMERCWPGSTAVRKCWQEAWIPIGHLSIKRSFTLNDVDDSKSAAHRTIHFLVIADRRVLTCAANVGHIKWVLLGQIDSVYPLHRGVRAIEAAHILMIKLAVEERRNEDASARAPPDTSSPSPQIQPRSGDPSESLPSTLETIQESVGEQPEHQQPQRGDQSMEELDEQEQMNRAIALSLEEATRVDQEEAPVDAFAEEPGPNPPPQRTVTDDAIVRSVDASSQTEQCDIQDMSRQLRFQAARIRELEGDTAAL